MTGTDPVTVTRRGLLALTGGVALAGCNALPNPFDSPPPRVDSSRLSEITSGSGPTIPETVPVAIADDHVQADIDRTNTLLSQAPLPFDARELPNGAMREELNQTADAARTRLEDAQGAASPFEALATLRDARGKGRTVATAWAYIDDGLRRADLADDAKALADDVAAFRERWSYVGDDPVRAVLVHHAIETLVAAAATNAEGRSDNPRVTRTAENLVTVSEYAADIERGRAALDTATHLYDGFRTDLQASRNLTPTFEAAVDELFGIVQDATDGFEENAPVSSYVDADVNNAVVRHPLQSLHDDLTRLEPITEYRDQGDIASAVLRVHRELTRLRAFQQLRERVENGEIDAIESSEDIQAVREAAITAIETAMEAADHPRLAREVLGEMAGLVRYADGELDSYSGETDVQVERISRDVGEYIHAAAVARVTPTVSDTVAAALTR